MKILKYIIISIICSSCGNPKLVEDDFCSTLSTVQSRIIERIESRYNVKASSTGFRGPGDIKSIKTVFKARRPLFKDESRELIMNLAAIYLTEVNNYLPVRRYLSNYPYNLDNVCVVVTGHHEIYKCFPESYKWVEVNRGKISYMPMKDGNTYFDGEETESFDDALRILEQQGKVPIYFKDHPALIKCETEVSINLNEGTTP